MTDKLAVLVRQNEHDRLRKIFASGKITIQNSDDELKFLQHLLQVAVLHSADETIEMLLEHYRQLDEETHLDQPKYSMNVRLIESPVIPEKVLTYIFDSSIFTFEELVLEVASKDMGPNVTVLLNRAARIFKTSLGYTMLNELKVLAEEKSNFMVKGVLQSISRPFAPWIPKPEYITGEPFDGTTDMLIKSAIPDLTIDQFPNPDDSASMRKLVRSKIESLMGIKLSNDLMNRKNYNALMNAMYSTSGPREQAELRRFIGVDPLSPAVSAVDNEAIEYGTTIFRVLGPLNLFRGPVGSDNNLNGRCGKYGCRMLTCTCWRLNDDEFDSDDEYGVDTSQEVDRTWFNGACWRCDKRIPRACYAVRRPVNAGGWRGTYCSFDCVENDNDEEPLDVIEVATLRIIKEQLNVIGLIDRKDDEPHPYAERSSELVDSDSEL